MSNPSIFYYFISCFLIESGSSYYFPRRQRQHKSQPNNNSHINTNTGPYNKSRAQIIDHEEDEIIDDSGDEQEEIILTKKEKSRDKNNIARTNMDRSGLKQIFGGLTFHLYQVYLEFKGLKELISSYPF
jgi:hypothetical protein